MSHELEIRNGRASMMYFGEVPWHRLGVALDKPATAAEALKAANLDFHVVKLPNIHRIPEGMGYTASRELISDTSFFTVRTDTGDVLGSRLGPGYTVVDNGDAFKFFDDLVGQGEAIYHTAGVLGKGERVWLLAKMPDYIRVRVNGHDDEVEKYLLLANSFDGTLAVKVKLTPIRVVCANTLGAALGIDEWGMAHDDPNTVSITHSRYAKRELAGAAEQLGLYNKLYAQLQDAFQRMADKPVTDEWVVNYVKEVWPAEREGKDDSKTALDWQGLVLDLYGGTAMGAELARGTLWGAYNAVTEAVDHWQSERANDSAMLKSMWFGGIRETRKQKALDMALELVTK